MSLLLVALGATARGDSLPTAAIEPPDRAIGSYPLPSASSQGRTAASDPGNPIRSVGTAALLLLVGAGAAAWVQRRKGTGPNADRSGAGLEAIRVVARASVGPRQTAVLVRVAGRQVLLGVAAQGPPTLLGDWPADDGRGGGPSS